MIVIGLAIWAYTFPDRWSCVGC